jgi:hypothetical protein
MVAVMARNRAVTTVAEKAELVREPVKLVAAEGA